MKILKARIEWMLKYANAPNIRLLVDKLPDHKDLRYERRGNLYFAEKDGYADFYSYSRPDEGFGGREFRLTMVDGSEAVLKGPWSSRAAVMNGAGFPPTIPVSITDDPAVWERGFTFYGAHVTVDFVMPVLKKNRMHLELRGRHGDPPAHTVAGKTSETLWWLRDVVQRVKEGQGPDEAAEASLAERDTKELKV